MHSFQDYKADAELGHEGLSFKNNGSPEKKFRKHCARGMERHRLVESIACVCVCVFLA